MRKSEGVNSALQNNYLFNENFFQRALRGLPLGGSGFLMRSGHALFGGNGNRIAWFQALL